MFFELRISNPVIALVPVIILAATMNAASAQQWHTMSFNADAPGIDQNPLKGLVPYSDERQAPDSFPHSLEWFYMPLSDVVVGPGIYDWRPLDRELNAIAGRGHQAIFRFYVDFPKKPTGIPKYLLDAGLRTFPYDDAGNAMSPTPSVAPDYRDPRLIDCMEQFIHTLGARYDGDVRIAWIEAGLYGFWGEWHVHDHPRAGESAGWEILQRNKDALLRAYAEAFTRTLVLVRYPKITKDRDLLAHFGFHDDSFLEDTLGSQRWQFWPLMQEFGTTETWRTRPIGGEIRPEFQAALWKHWPNVEGEDVKTAIVITRATWMLNDGLFRTAPTSEERTNALRAERLMGYTLFCTASRVATGRGTSAEVSVRVENRGIAPFYYAWPAELRALDARGNLIGETRIAWPLPSLLPGKKQEWDAVLDAPKDEIRSLLLRIANPMPGGHPVSFANAEMGTEREGWLTLDTNGNR
jgi:hypothetical protein